MLNLSDQQLDPEAKRRIRLVMELDGEDAAKELSKLIDVCVYCSFCSAFELGVFEILLNPFGIDQAKKEIWRVELAKEIGIDYESE